MAGEYYEKQTLQWDYVKPWGTLYPFVVRAQRPLSTHEIVLLSAFCTDAFGPGGCFPSADQRWSVQWSVEQFSFRTEADRTMFVLAHSGDGPAVA